MSLSLLDPGQVIKDVHDSVNNALKVSVVASVSSSTSIQDGVDANLKATVTAASALKVDGSAVTQPVSAASLPLPSGAATSANQDTSNTSLGNIDTKVPSGLTVTSTRLLVDGSGVTQPVSIATAPVLVAGSAIIGKVGIDQTTPGTTNKVSIGTDGTVAATQSGVWTVQPGNTANTTAWKVDGSAVTQPISSTLDTASTSSVTSVASSATSVSILALTAGRKGAYFYNDSTQVLYLKFGGTASSSSYTVQIGAGGFFEMPSKPVYTGAIDGIWASANGNLRITELT